MAHLMYCYAVAGKWGLCSRSGGLLRRAGARHGVIQYEVSIAIAIRTLGRQIVLLEVGMGI